MEKQFETVEEFLARGGKIKTIAAHKAHNAQKPQTIKVPYRIGKK